MKTRTLKDGTEVEQYEHNIILNVITKCPSKYKLIDNEKGKEDIGQKPIGGEKQVVHWKKIDG